MPTGNHFFHFFPKILTLVHHVVLCYEDQDQKGQDKISEFVYLKLDQNGAQSKARNELIPTVRTKKKQIVKKVAKGVLTMMQ